VATPVVKLSINGQVVGPRLPSSLGASQQQLIESLDSGSESEIGTEDSLISQACFPHAAMSDCPASESDDADSGPDDISDTEDAPEWQFETGEIKSTDQLYTFCPAPHRVQILRLFSRHFCRHPFFVDRNGTHHTATQIRYLCVYEMYHFCKRRGLREVWAYLWNSWYRTDMWDLWARSSDPTHLSRLRTTMTVENHWKLLKHHHIDFARRPQVDQTVYIIAVYVVRSMYEKVEQLSYDYRTGRGNALIPFQAAFKAEWKRLENLPISQRDYETNISEWKCKCGSQPGNAFHMCKHLVRKAGKPDPAFFRHIHRRRVPPLYRDSFLNNAVDGADMGSISDGDDYGPEIVFSANLKHRAEEDPPNGRAEKQVCNLFNFLVLSITYHSLSGTFGY
jgi:hypothetical protein